MIKKICNMCGVCCSNPIEHGYACVLDKSELSLFKDVAVDDGNGFGDFVIPYTNGKCSFLTVDNKCGIHEIRPMSCKAYFCTHIVYN